jgi:hypothetical protein
VDFDPQDELIGWDMSHGFTIADAMAGVSVFGTTGSGKTSGSGWAERRAAHVEALTQAGAGKVFKEPVAQPSRSTPQRPPPLEQRNASACSIPKYCAAGGTWRGKGLREEGYAVPPMSRNTDSASSTRTGQDSSCTIRAWP